MYDEEGSRVQDGIRIIVKSRRVIEVTRMGLISVVVGVDLVTSSKDRTQD